jgi:hypothetical protein
MATQIDCVINHGNTTWKEDEQHSDILATVASLNHLYRVM